MSERAGILRHPVPVASGLAVASGYAWWATGVAPFTERSAIAVALPSAVVVVAYAAAGGLTPRGRRAGDHYSRRSRDVSPPAALPWLVILVLAVGLEAVGLSLGGRSPVVPTLSTTVDHLLATHWGRFALFAAWVTVGARPVLGLVYGDRDGAP